jgi:hypothetical protein
MKSTPNRATAPQNLIYDVARAFMRQLTESRVVFSEKAG